MAHVALHSAATGLRALSMQLDVTANNIANAGNNGFKASRANFEDLMYQYYKLPGSQNALGDNAPIGIGIGHGTKISGTQLDLSPGSPVITGRELDLMIEGTGFLQVQGVDGPLFTRTGKLFVNRDGDLVVNGTDGYKIDPPINIDPNATQISISEDGRVMVTVGNEPEAQDAGSIQLARFVNPQGLIQLGGNLYRQSEGSGDPILGNPGEEGLGVLKQGMVEASNVDPVKELVDLIKTQRTFELNSQSIQAADQMLQQISNLRR